MSNVAINIAAEYTGKPAFDKANKSVKSLEKSVKRFAGGLGVGLGLSAVSAFGKAAVKAFAADEASARRLAGAVDNLGLSFSQAKVTDFIANLEKSSNIADDILRPSFQALLTTTGSLTKSQELLNNAIQISRASGIDLATVSQDLANGYVGITKGLKKYNTGLTQAELKSKSFADILGIMLTRSAGAASAYLETTSYKLDALTLAGDNAKETIGAGLVDAFAILGGGSSTADAVKAIDSIAKGINNITLFTAQAISAIMKLYKGFEFIGSLGGLLSENGPVFGQFQDKPTSTNRSKSPAGTAARTAQQRQAEAAAAKRAKELAALQAKQVKSQKALTEEQKKQALLKKAGSIFDLEQIQLIAALKGKLSDEDRKRVELQFALITGNTAEATKLTNEIAKAQGLGKDLAAYLASLPNAKNPFEAWSDYLDMLAKKAALIVTGDPNYNSSLGWNNNPSFPDTNNMPDTNVAPIPSYVGTPFGQAGGNGSGYIGTPFGQAGSIVVQIDGKAVASALQDSSMSGTASSVNRLNGGWSIS